MAHFSYDLKMQRPKAVAQKISKSIGFECDWRICQRTLKFDSFTLETMTKYRGKKYFEQNKNSNRAK